MMPWSPSDSLDLYDGYFGTYIASAQLMLYIAIGKFLPLSAYIDGNPSCSGIIAASTLLI